jgi:hypothetical protein
MEFIHLKVIVENNIQLSYILKQQCLSVWAVPGRFFLSLPVPYGASLDVTDSKEKRNQGQSDFLRQKIW